MPAKAPAKSELDQWYESGRDRVIPRDPPEPPPDWMAFALRFCRDGEDGLARHMKVVPAEHINVHGVLCPCLNGDDGGSDVAVTVPEREFVECPGGCGRWYMRDAETVWAARLPRDDS